MATDQERTLQEIARYVNGALFGDGGVRIAGLSGLVDARVGELSFAAGARAARGIGLTKASALIVPRGVEVATIPSIQVDDPASAFDSLIPLFRPPSDWDGPPVHELAFVADDVELGVGAVVQPGASVMPGAKIGADTIIHSGARIGARARVGKGCVVHPNVVVGPGSVLGDRVIVHSCTVIGADGFGFRPGPSGIEKLEHIGTVEIGDDVEIGACVTIDRARFGRTRVGRGSKLDDQVHIAHNVQIGDHCLIIAQTGISGSTIVEDGVMIGGQVGTVGHIRIGRGARLAARAGISKDVAPGAVLYGFVAGEHRAKKREEAAMRRLPDLLRRVRELETHLGLRRSRDTDGPDGGGHEDGGGAHHGSNPEGPAGA